jgi:hypothetical protein
MVAFSPSALRLLNAAVAQFMDAARQQRWSTWTQEHPGIRRRPGARWDEWGDAPLPSDIADIALLALDRLTAQLRQERERAQSRQMEDTVADLDNEISHIRSIERFIHQAPTEPTRRVG